MKVSISYKFAGLPVDQVRSNLKKIKESLDNLGIENFILTLDCPDHIIKPDLLMQTMQKEISSCDIMMAFVNNPVRSEGMLLELGIARGMGKFIVIFVEKQYESSLFLSYGIADEIVFFDDGKDLHGKIIEYFGLKVGRNKIDKIDNQILELFAQRFGEIEKIAKYKGLVKKQALDSKRRNEVLQSKLGKAENLGLDKNMVEEIWNVIHKYALKYEEKNLNNNQ